MSRNLLAINTLNTLQAKHC